jgi:ribonuclease HI
VFTREGWTRGTGALPAVKGLVCFTHGFRTVEGTGAGFYGQYVGRRLSISVGKHATVFQVDVYAILAYVHETNSQDRPEKFVSICFDSQASLKALQAAKATSPLVRHCQKLLNVISTRHTVGLYWVPGHAELRRYEIVDKLTKDGSVQKFVEPERSTGFSKQNIRRKINPGWITDIWYCGVVLVVHRDRLENWFRFLTWLQRPDCCPLIGHNPVLLLVFLPDITTGEDIYM